MSDTPRFVRITWDDAEDHETDKTWVDIEDVEEFAASSAIVKTGGYLIMETDRLYILSRDWIVGCATYGKLTKIPKAMTLKIEDFPDETA